NDDFESLAQDSRTQSSDQRVLTLNPEVRLGFYVPDGLSPFGGTTDWITTGRIRFQETRVSSRGTPQTLVNQANDQWSIRTQLDFYGEGRRHALFTALDFRHQLKAKFATTEEVQHGVPRDKEVNFEAGYLYSNNDDLKFQIGASISRNLGRQTGVFLVNGETLAAREDLEDALMGLVDPTITPLTGSGTDYGIAFSAEWTHEFFQREGGPDWAFSTKVTEGNLFFGGTGVDTFRPQLRFFWTNELRIPLFGNLFLVPSLEHYFLRVRAQDAGAGPRNFNQLTTGIKFRYAFDVKPMFQRLKNAFSFRNRPDAR
ncbi:MAG: hypothetical protein V3T83_17920, partial [Acidobacteriota bacterium]